MPRKKAQHKRAAELSQAEIEKLLRGVGMLIKAKRKEKSSLEDFSYEINISRSALARYEAGGDMMLSSFLKVVHGLDLTAEQFFSEIK